MSKTLGIIGGMGPLATAFLFKKIVTMTEAKSDQEHLDILIYNNTSIYDRSDFILNKGKNPRKQLIESAIKLENMGSEYLIMPCNTAHYFYNDIIKHISIPFINMIEVTANYFYYNFSMFDRVGLLATEGTYKSKVYEKFFNKRGIKIIKPSKKNQKYITELIYGIKESKKNINLNNFYKVLDELNKRDVKVIILGCTELSVANKLYRLSGDFIDPMDELSKRAIVFGGKKLRKKGEDIRL
ncbi:MAG: amino acid racemase [Firmicutes bacterium]|nr:amino acid racemase [Bacillota bacterium]